MKILLVGKFVASWHEPTWIKSLKELGHDVSEFSTSSIKYFADKFQKRFLFGPLIKKINSLLELKVKLLTPDIIILYRALEITGESVVKFKNSGITVVTYNNDNIFGALSKKRYWAFYKKQILSSNLNLIYRNSDIIKFKKLTPIKSYVLKSYYIPWLHNGNPKKNKKFDVSFLGHYEPDKRDSYINELILSIPDLKMQLRGSGWEKVKVNKAWKNFDLREVYNHEYTKILSNSKIGLCFFSTWNLDTYTRRVFEIPACGSMLLCQSSSTMKELFKEDLEAVYFSCKEEFIEKTKYYLHNEELRIKIAIKGQERIKKSKYDIHSRMKELLSILNSLKN